LEEAETQQLSQPHELMLFTYSELQKKHFCRKNGGGKENSPNFIHLLRHFSLHKVTKLRTVTSSVNHFDSLHRKSGLGLMMGNSLQKVVVGNKITVRKALEIAKPRHFHSSSLGK
jgi:hypothetical protein